MEHIFKLFEFLIIVSALIFAWNLLTFAKKSGSGFSFKINEFVELSVEPSKVAFESGEVQKTELNTSQKLPADYVYLNHAAFLREHKQTEFQERTGLEGLPHYDIRVILDSYYKGALDNVKYVEYFLHESYPEPIQSRSKRKNNFLLKELANGAYVLQAKVHLNDRREPILLQRYITLNPDEYFNKT